MAQGITKNDSLQRTVTPPDPSDRNNDFYDNTETYGLQGGVIEVAGEIENPGIIDLSKLGNIRKGVGY